MKKISSSAHRVAFNVMLASFLFLGPSVRADEAYSPPLPSRPVVLLDYYHRTPKQTMIGKHLLTGSYTDTNGRYRTDDFSHTNSYDSLLNALEKDFDLRVHESALVDENLRGADIVVVLNPESPKVAPNVPVLSAAEIAALTGFVERGGTIIAMLNSVGAAGTETFETTQMRKLFNAFSLDWNDVNTEYSDITVGPRHGYFYDIPIFHYGAGCTIRILDGASAPEILLNVKEDNGAREVRGPGVVLVRKGRGKFIAVGDTGSWGGGNMSRPWVENRKLLLQLFNYAKHSEGVPVSTYSAGKPLRYQMRIGQLNVIPTGNPLAAAPQPGMQVYTPRPRTGIPYQEAEALLDLERVDVPGGDGNQFHLSLRSLTRFEKAEALSPAEKITVETSRLGGVVGIEPVGDEARWLAPDVGSLFGFVPNDAIRVGDRWQKIHQLRINPVRGNEPATTRPVETEMIYLRNETFAGHECRVIRTQAEVWLSDINAGIADIVPFENDRQWGGQRFELMAGRGGRILFKREQWLDAKTGAVVKADTQTRLLAWLHRIGEPLPLRTVDKDDRMMVSLASMVTFTLQD